MSGNALILHVREKLQCLHFSISPDSGETLIRRGGIQIQIQIQIFYLHTCDHTVE